jgi:isopenicillin N synthase-like dioxygenase
MSHDFPVIDIAAVRQPQVSAAARFETARQVASACEEIGFFAVTGHGVPGAVIADLVAQPYAFFNLPLAEKLAVRRPRPEQNRGYIAPGEERLARLRGDETPPDLKELSQLVRSIRQRRRTSPGRQRIQASHLICGRCARSRFGPPCKPIGTNLTGSPSRCAGFLLKHSIWHLISSMTKSTGTLASCA